jgi:hypothetical protein
VGDAEHSFDIVGMLAMTSGRFRDFYRAVCGDISAMGAAAASGGSIAPNASNAACCAAVTPVRPVMSTRS